MALPTVFQSIRPQDFTITPVTVNKRYTVSRTDLYSGTTPNTASGYKIWTAVHSNEKMKLGTAAARTYPTNSFDSSYQYVIWKSIDARYYRFPYDSYATMEHPNSRYTYKFLNYSASILSVPQQVFGEGILPGSVQISSSLGWLYDDGNGNLYDSSIDTGSFATRHNLVAHWNVHDQFRKYDDELLKPNNYPKFRSGITIPYRSHTFSPDADSVSKNLMLLAPINTFSDTGSRILGESLWVFFSDVTPPTPGSWYVRTDDRDEFNFASNQDFTIAFWMYPIDFSGDPVGIITKNGIIRKETFGDGYVYKGEQTIPSSQVFSQSYFVESTNVYPYDISLMGGSNYGKTLFRRSDGINTMTITSSASTYEVRHIAAVKSGSLCLLYVNGKLEATGSDGTLNPVNKHCLVFGSKNGVDTGFQGALNDIRIYNRAFPAATIATFAKSGSLAMLQTAVVGNVFYKTGNIVISSHDPKYNTIFDNNFAMHFRNTHTIYQYETIIRIPKGLFNISQNPSALQNANTDLLRNEFTGSNPNVDLFPYATSIGLYNDQKELLAVGKLNQALQMRNDVDLNISVRWDG